MNKYYIYRIDENGKPKQTQTVHGENVDAVWNSNKSWYIEGIFIVTNADGTGAKLFRLHRRDTRPAEIETPPAAPQPLRVCSRCLMAIESREGSQITRKIYLDSDDETLCDWCDECTDGILYELL